MVKKRYYGNECFGLARDRIEVCQMYLFTTTDIGHKMSMVLDTKKPNFWLSIQVVVNRGTWFIMTFCYKMRQFCYKTRHLLQNATILLQSVTFITKCVGVTSQRRI